jgi:hypothetical protein
MAEVIVQAKIEAVIASNRIHKVVRDPAGEKRVKDDLKARLWAETEKDQIPKSEFDSLYRAKLLSFAAYMDGAYVENDPTDGTPALMVPKPVYQNELKLSYTVDGKSYTQTVVYDTEKKCLEKDQPFYITVDQDNPRKILKKSKDDYREQPAAPSGEIGGGAFVVFLIIAFMLAMIAMGK